MIPAPLPTNEEQRLEKLYELDIMDTLEEQAYDDITHLTAQICGVPIALISLIDRDRQFLKSHHGLDVNEVSRELGFCPHAILDNDLTVVEDATKDERFHDNPLVTGGPEVKFYAGAPLIMPGDLRVGTLCVVSTEPRTLTDDQAKTLETLARQVVSQLELRQTVKQLEAANLNGQKVLIDLARSEERERTRGEMMEMLAKARPIKDVLETLAIRIEDELEGASCSILLLDREKNLLHCGAAPNLPGFYNDAIEGLEIGPGVGSCGNAAATGKRTIAADIQLHPFWEPFRDLAARAELAACWSEPIFDGSNNVLGTFAIYYGSPREPDESDFMVIERASKLAGIAIQRRNEEQMLVDAKEMSESANRAKSDFLASMSHELRTPLTSSLGSLGLLKSIAVDEISEKSQELLEIAMRNNEALLRLVNELLDFEKILSGTLEIKTSRHNICELTSNIIKDNQGYAQTQSVKFVFRDPKTSLFAAVQEHRFAQVLNNLLSNAAKFSESGSDVEISVESDNGCIFVKVKDYGPGIPEDFREKIYHQFTQIDSSSTRKHGGTGLGLSISKALMENMGGTLDFETEVGVGSTFFVTLPASD